MSVQIWLHCNKCFLRPDGGSNKFFLANCKHILCRNCAQLTAENNRCVQCNSEVSMIPLNNDIPSNIRPFFSPIAEMLDEANRVLKYQTDQRIILEKLITNRYNTLKVEYNKMLSAYKEEKNKCQALKQVIASMQYDSSRYRAPSVAATSTHFSDISVNSNPDQVSENTFQGFRGNCTTDDENNTSGNLNFSQLFLR